MDGRYYRYLDNKSEVAKDMASTSQADMARATNKQRKEMRKAQGGANTATLLRTKRERDGLHFGAWVESNRIESNRMNRT